MDWNNYNTATSDYVRINWAIATVLSSTIMAMAMLYIVTEWCLQSHLSTANMSDAARGLSLTRHFRWLTSPFRDAVHYAIEGVYAVRKLLKRTKNQDGADDAISKSRQNRRSVRWTKKPARQHQDKALHMVISLDDLTPGRPRASSDAPLIGRDDMSALPPSLSDADAASRQSQVGGSHTSRTSTEQWVLPEVQSPGSLHVQDAGSTLVRYASDRRLSG
jgi:hypothetical protein